MQYSPYSTYQSNLQPYMPGVNQDPTPSAETERKQLHLRPVMDYGDEGSAHYHPRTRSPQDWVPHYEGGPHSRGASPLGQMVNMPRLSPRPAEEPKLSTFKPSEEPHFTPEGIVWTPTSDPVATLPRNYHSQGSMPTSSGASSSDNMPPFPPAHVVDACTSSTLPCFTDAHKTPGRTDRPKQRSSKRPKDSKSRKPPRRIDSEESSKSASSPASELLVYCDELLADLERVAKSWDCCVC